MFDEADDDFLIVPEAAEVMRMAKRTLDNHRWKGTGPKFRRHGGRIVYRRGDLREWSEQRAARMAAEKEESRSPSSGPAGRNCRRPSGTDLAKGKCPEAPLERQPKHSNWPLHSDSAGAGKGRVGSHTTS